MINYALCIKEYRQRKLLTQEDLAKILNVSVTSITRWENSKFEPTIAIKRKLMVLFEKAGMKVGEYHVTF